MFVPKITSFILNIVLLMVLQPVCLMAMDSDCSSDCADNAADIIRGNFMSEDEKIEELKDIFKEEKIDPNVVYEGAQMSLLHIAIRSRQLKVFLFLIERGANLNIEDVDGETPLFTAAMYGNFPMVAVLIEKLEKLAGKNIGVNHRANHKICFGNSVLHAAVGERGCDADECAQCKIGNKCGNESERLKIIELLIKKGAIVDAINDNGDTAFLSAISHGYPIIAEFLIKNGADPRKKNKNGDTALHYAVRENLLAIAPFLIEKDVLVDEKNNDGMTALHLATAGEKPEMIEYLVGIGANVNAKNKMGDTALHQAVRRGSKAIVALLYWNGASLDAKNENGETALHIAVKYGYLEIVDFLLGKGADINAQDNRGKTVLHIEAETRKKHNIGGGAVFLLKMMNIVEYLCNHGAKLDIKDENGETALHVAARCGDHLMAISLLEKGVDVNAKNKQNRSALHIAAHYENFEMVAFFIKNGANINEKDANGNTVLHRAAKRGGNIKKLIELGADPTIANNDMQTPLHIAAKEGYWNLVIFLVKKGVDKDKKDCFGWTAFDWARIAMETKLRFFIGYTKLVCSEDETNVFAHVSDLFIKQAPMVQKKKIESVEKSEKLPKKNITTLHGAVKSGKLQKVKELIGLGADIEEHDFRGRTPLHVAAQYGMLEIGRYLVQKGIKVNKGEIGTDNGALHVAAGYGYLDFVELLITSGAKINKENVFKQTALHSAAEHGFLNIVDLLIKRGVVRQQEDTLGVTAFSCAKKNMKSAIKSFIVFCGLMGMSECANSLQLAASNIYKAAYNCVEDIKIQPSNIWLKK